MIYYTIDQEKGTQDQLYLKNTTRKCVVIGVDADDEIYVAGSSGNIANVVYLIELGKKHMLELGDDDTNGG